MKLKNPETTTRRTRAEHKFSDGGEYKEKVKSEKVLVDYYQPLDHERSCVDVYFRNGRL